jgi:hypothetical protein
MIGHRPKGPKRDDYGTPPDSGSGVKPPAGTRVEGRMTKDEAHRRFRGYMYALHKLIKSGGPDVPGLYKIDGNGLCVQCPHCGAFGVCEVEGDVIIPPVCCVPSEAIDPDPEGLI